MIFNQLPQAKNLKTKTFILKIPVKVLMILSLYSCTLRLIVSISPPVINKTGTIEKVNTTYNSEVISISSTISPLTNRTKIKIANTTYDSEISRDLSNVNATAQQNSLQDLHNLMIDFSVDTINATSIQVTINTLKHIPDSESLHDKGKSYHLMYNISYRLRTAELILLKTSDHCFKVPMKVYDDVKACKSLVYDFGHYNDTSDTDYDYLFNHCEPQSFGTPVNSTSSSTIAVINNLLPSRYYEFRVNPYLIQSGEESNSIPMLYNTGDLKHNCTKEGIPLYPPQTDIGSFQLIYPTKHEADSAAKGQLVRQVKLYWRPVPILFEGHNINTYVKCFEHGRFNPAFEKLIHKDEAEFHSLDLKETLQNPNCTYTCQIQSKNSCGSSLDSSIIQIPEQQRIIETRGGLKVYAVSLSDGSYLLKWTDIRKIAPEVIKSNATNQMGVYTVYWCKQQNCELGIEAMKKFPVTHVSYLDEPHAIHIHGSLTTYAADSRGFGISYRSWKSQNFTGIHWSPCIGLSVHAFQPFETLTAYSISSATISFTWNVHGGCIALMTLFDRLHINYCELEPIDPCVTLADKEIFAHSFNYYENNSNCFDRSVKNDLTAKASINDLKPATKYVLRIRGALHGRGRNIWSDNLIFRTVPESAHQCKKWSPILFVVISIVVILTCSMFFYCRRSIKHYKSILKLYKRTNVKLPQRFEDPWYKNDEFGEVGLRYWFSRESRDVEPQIETSMNVHKLSNESNQIQGALVDNLFSDEDNQSDQAERTSSSVPDYVDPSLILTSQPTQSNHDNTQDNLDESLSRERDTISDIDEISITSHSSFLENILNDDS